MVSYRIKRFFASPYTVMGVVLIMYAIKVTSKLLVGHQINSPIMIGDGFHNVADIFEALLVIGAVFISRMPVSDRYPFGRKNIESLFSVAVGVGLLFMAIRIALQSAGTLWFVSTGSDVPLKMGVSEGSWAASIMLGSALLSMMVSYYQIRIGRKTHHDALVADGQETRSDGMIELSAFAGIVCEYLFEASWLEYVFALGIAALMIKTGWEILSRGLDALLQHSIGLLHDDIIKMIIERIPGVHSVAQLKTFRVGNKVILIVKVLTRANEQVNRLLRRGMATLIGRYLESVDFKDGEFFIRFDEPNPERHRVAFGLRKEQGGSFVLADGTADMTHVTVCDFEHGNVVRSTMHDLSGRRVDLDEFLFTKRVKELVLFAQPSVTLKRIPIVQPSTWRLNALGL